VASGRWRADEYWLGAAGAQVLQQPLALQMAGISVGTLCAQVPQRPLALQMAGIGISGGGSSNQDDVGNSVLRYLLPRLEILPSLVRSPHTELPGSIAKILRGALKRIKGEQVELKEVYRRYACECAAGT
jgi:hypothetical protein